MDREILCRVLKNAMKAQTIVYLYNDSTSKDDYYGGFVQLVTKDYVVMRLVSSAARAAGYLIARLDMVFRVDNGGQSAKRAERLYYLNQERHEGFAVSTFGNLLVNVLRVAMDQKIAISVFLDQDEERESLNGYVRHVVKEHIVMDDLDDDAESYGEVHFELPSIIDIQLGSRDLTNLALLYEQPKWD
ncbi:hypothetical protein [Listeria newyorkensis]|uniref:Uncharacterized protein n=1 Tax=Listeria newyorkensis TaxID=1497681 RepID=A0A841YTM1_9LIST|nr:hypothetical protein [Listeria newyorkensis]MBC1456598.1 hypothetical protein [Listeria newyorkensis]